LLALFLCYLFLPLFNQVSGKTISRNIFEYKSYASFLFLLPVGIGLLAGLYPAFVLSAFKPISVLKGRFATSNSGIFIRKILVIIQFSISITLMVGTMVIYAQLHFMRSKPLGFDKSQLLVIDNHGDQNINTFKRQLSEIPAVQSSSISTSIPGRDYSNNIIVKTDIKNNRGEMQQVNLNFYNVDYDFLDLYKIKLIAGRSFSKIFSTDSVHAMILNNTALKSLGYISPEEVIGKHFAREGTEGTIIGVVDDFNFHSLKENVQPLSLQTGMGFWEFITLKIDAKDLPATLKTLKTKWDNIIPNRPFNYFFLDEAFDKQYNAENRFGRLFLYFAILAIFISNLGLLALTSYSTLQRTREIGIRKILGASVSAIVNLFSKDFLKLVVIAFAVASPISWFVMNKWLQDFAYRINISWWIFAIAGFSAIFIAWVTVSFHAMKAAVANHVESLRTE
jgi:putative ABC transport system permease protein